VPTSQIDRAYGYFVGDRLEQRLSFDVPANAVLEVDSIPKPGRINGWLDLLAVSSERLTDQTVMKLDYQIMAGGPNTRLIFLPARVLRFRPPAFGAEPRSAISESRVDAVAVSVSPLTEPVVSERNGLGELRGDRAPAALDTAAITRRVGALSVALGATALAWFALAYRRSRGTRAAPFARAARQIESARGPRSGNIGKASNGGKGGKGGGGDSWFEATLRTLHRAFDQSAGKSMLSADVDEFVQQRPVFEPLRAEIVRFFEQSSARFYSVPPADEPAQSAQSADQLALLAKRLARAEARVR
jgi:mxaA protein